MKNNKLIIMSIVIILLLWTIFSSIINNSIYLPKVSEIFNEIIIIVFEKDFIKAISSTLLRTFNSFIIALFLALIIGWMSAINKYIYNFIYPVMAVVKSIPTIAFIVIILIWVSKDLAPTLIGVIISFPLLYDVVLNSIETSSTKILDMCKVYRVPKGKVIKYIYLPNIYFNIMAVTTSVLSLILKVVIAGEVYGQPKYGIGAYIQLEKMNLNTVGIFAWIIIVGIITVIFDLLLKLVRKRGW